MDNHDLYIYTSMHITQEQSTYVFLCISLQCMYALVCLCILNDLNAQYYRFIIFCCKSGQNGS